MDNNAPVTLTNSGNASPYATTFLVSTAGAHTITYDSTDAQASHADLVLTLTGSGFVQGFDAAHSSVVTFIGGSGFGGFWESEFSDADQDHGIGQWHEQERKHLRHALKLLSCLDLRHALGWQIDTDGSGDYNRNT